jgi:hypothetical protein
MKSKILKIGVVSVFVILIGTFVAWQSGLLKSFPGKEKESEEIEVTIEEEKDTVMEIEMDRGMMNSSKSMVVPLDLEKEVDHVMSSSKSMPVKLPKPETQQKVPVNDKMK